MSAEAESLDRIDAENQDTLEPINITISNENGIN